MYDPHAVISSKRITHGQAPYQHQQKTQLEMLANQNNLGRCVEIFANPGKNSRAIFKISSYRDPSTV
jgi:hypothetical protein